jgi:hypothetical protein
MTTYVGEEAECIFCASGLRPDSFQTHVFDGRAFTCPSPSPERDSGEVKALAALPPAGMLWDELVKARNELFDLRIRCGCGPDQEGPDIWQRAGELEAVLKELLPMVGWRNLSDDELRWEAEQGNEAAPKILRARAVLEQSS